LTKLSTRLLRWATALTMLTVTFALPLARGNTVAHAASSVGHQSVAHLSYTGTGSFATASGTSTGAGLRSGPSVDQSVPHTGLAYARVPAAHVPVVSGNAIASTNPGFSGFNALSQLDQHQAGTGSYAGSQYSLEPPDQAMCQGGGYVVEGVNDAMRVFDTGGNVLTPATALNQFFNLAPEVVRPNGPYGDFASDPKCYYDPGTGHFFLTLLQIDVNPVTGNFGTSSHQLIAVTKTSDPTGKWNLFRFDTTDDGSNGTPAHAGCPCFGDQPLIGADANGFYVTTNEFSLAGSAFNGAQVYAMSKTALAAGKLPTVVHIDNIPLAESISYSIQPATAPPGGTYAPNTEYFLSSLDFSGSLDNRIASWALTGTLTLSNTTPVVSLTSTVLPSEVYGIAPASQQKPGALPLGDAYNQKLELLDSNDDRMNQVVFANNHLYGAVDTVVQTPNGPTRAGIAYFLVDPTAGAVTAQGYVAVNGENVSYPSIGVNPSGNGVMTFSLVGPDYYPSTAYAPISANGTVGAVHIAGAGAAPDDGFTGYAIFGGGRVARWGDYSSAVAGSDGSIWMAQEYIPNAPRTFYANWGTYISHVSL